MAQVDFFWARREITVVRACTCVHLLVAVLCLLAPPLMGQQGAALKSCPSATALKLDVVVGYVTSKVPDARIADLVSVCHVNFTLDATAIERLSNAGASRTVFDALDHDTISRLTLSQAQAEVTALENRKQSNEVPINGERDTALASSDADYSIQRRKIAEDSFRTTAQKTTDLAALDRSHDDYRSRTTARYASDLGRKNELLERRIALLKQSLYPLGGSPPKYLDYVADDSRLSAMVGGEEYWFNVPPSRAKSLVEQWANVKVLRRYDDQGSRERFLAAALNVEPIAGRPRVIIEAEAKDKEIQTLLSSARQYVSSERYEEAKATFGKVLLLDPSNPEAKNGVDSSLAGIEKSQNDSATRAAEAARSAQLRDELRRNPKDVKGAWFDATSNLLWTDRDNGYDITWADAATYCQGITAGGMRGWRLGSLNELQRLGEGPIKTASPSLKDALSSRTAKVWTYHIKGSITLTRPYSWASLPNQAVKFTEENIAKDNAQGRALCVVDLGSVAVGGRSATPVTARENAVSASDEHTLRLTPASPWAERNATIVAPPNGTQAYNLYQIDAREFQSGGVIQVDIDIPSNSGTDGSFDLYPGGAIIPRTGRPVGTLVGRYDVRKGTSTHFQYRFLSGDAFSLGLEGNWFSPRGATGIVHFKVTVSGGRNR